MSVCARIRRILHVDKAGHAGTLDPMAEGVLPVALGRACKSISQIGDGTKVYEATLLLGVTTDTEDVTGKVLSTYDGDFPSEEEIRKVCLSFVGGYDQLTPMYSARQVNGRRLYDIARSGEEVSRPVKHIDIESLEILEINIPRVRFSVKCSKGTYVRTLCADIGESLGTGGCMETLKRTAVGAYKIEDTLTFSDIGKLYDEGRVDSVLTVEAPTAVAIGNFDGTHIGHRALLKELRKVSEKHGLRSLCLIIEPSGKTVEEREERRNGLLALGIDYVIELPLDEELKNMSAERFLSEILIKKLNMKYLAGGRDIAFGHNKEGNESFLRENAAKYGFHFKLIEKITLPDAENEEISSTRLREELSRGNMEMVEKLMGHPYSITGEVVHGNHIGTDILSVPTVNIPVSGGIRIPPYGVYAVRVTVYGREEKNVRNDHTAPKGKNAVRYEGIADIGVKPTVGSEGIGLEAFLFTDECPELYGKTVRAELLHFIRGERTFDSLLSLKEQITGLDIPAAKDFFSKKSLH